MENFSEQNLEREKTILWEEKMKDLEKVVDGLGKHLDENIKETVAAFNMLNIPTSSSCGGHPEEERYPYVMGEPDGEPSFRWVGEEKLIEDLLARFNLKTKKEVFRNNEAKEEYYRRVKEDLKYQETPEYQEWYRNVEPLIDDMSALISEFYQSRQTPEDERLYLSPIYANYRMESGLENKDADKQLDVKEREKRILTAQEEFKAFTEFLKEKYFSA